MSDAKEILLCRTRHFVIERNICMAKNQNSGRVQNKEGKINDKVINVEGLTHIQRERERNNA